MTTPRTSTNPDDYTGTEHTRSLLDAWGFDVVTHSDAGTFPLRPRDPRTEVMAAHLGTWLCNAGVAHDHFTITIDGPLIALIGVTDRRVMLDREAREYAKHNRTIDRAWLGHVGTKRACRAAGWASAAEASAYLEHERANRRRRSVMEALERRLVETTG